MVPGNKTPLSRCSSYFSWYVEIVLHSLINMFSSVTYSINIIGTKIDLREDRETLTALAELNLSCIKREQGQKLANKIRAVKYMECSALTQRGLKQVIFLSNLTNSIYYLFNSAPGIKI